ncbi:sensor histidine kinase [Paenibacillus sp. BC26]|uniref:cache domain-containing sensor histidine kinase n=1 Tax=Paenibacillus sp. BC26 TaxID=1881032 RepID=UPI0008EADDC5|nr:sensor histidine kinase [Paenibacillus sp. BC26]SFS84090.1 two-component system, sensor histidine kinase YesM [Paenibacillus sp. BC26]
MIVTLWKTFRGYIASKLRNQLIMLFSAIAACIVILLSYLSYLQSAGMNRDHFIESNRKILKLVNQNLDGYLDRIDELSISLRKDSQFMDAIISKEYGGQLYIQNQLKNLYYSSDDIEALSIYTPKTGLQYTMSKAFINLRQEATVAPEGERWYREAAQSHKFRSIESGYGLNETDHGNFLIFHRILINIADKKPLAAISITHNLKEIKRILQDITGESGEYIGIFNEANELFYAEGPNLTVDSTAQLLRSIPVDAVDTEQRSWTIHDTRYLAIYNVSPHNGWKLVTLTPYSVLNKEAANARRINLIAGSAAVVLLISVIVIAANAITRRLMQLSRQIVMLGDGIFEVQGEIKGSDEIAHLSRKYNQMIVKINDLIGERYEMQLNERNARLIALEAQINPHFLYNSLQAISTEAIISGMDRIQDMVDALASSLRYSIKEAETVRVKEELAHIGNYMLLQQARFGTRLRLHVEVEEAVKEAWIPKMIVQILVENTIKHGLEQMTGDMDVNVRATSREGLLVLTVSDNGPGISAERLTEIRAFLDSHLLEYREGIGLNNVNARIKLLFGPEYGLNIDSQHGTGTEVIVTLPLKEERPYVQGYHH